jgi:hypothetical protein
MPLRTRDNRHGANNRSHVFVCGVRRVRSAILFVSLMLCPATVAPAQPTEHAPDTMEARLRACTPQAPSVTMSVVGGAILVLSGVLFFIVLARGQTAVRTEPAAYRFSVAVRPPRALPAALNGFGLWVGLMVALTIVNYGFPIAHSLATPGTAVPVVEVGERW